MEGWQGPFTAAVLLGTLGALASGRAGADLVTVGALVLLLAAGVLEPGEAVAGFANTGLVTIAMLYVVAAGLHETGAVSVLTNRLLGRPRTTLEAQARMIVPVAGLSAFVNNTPIVAMFLPTLREIARRNGLAASQLFMPLSFAAILGGICTLIGTSTNLVMLGLIQRHNGEHPEATLEEPGMWTIGRVGVPIALAGVAYLLIFGRRLLPRHGGAEPLQGRAREYMAPMRVPPGSPLVGRTVEGAGLRHLPGLFLSRIERGGVPIVAVGPDEVLEAGDVLVFVGVLDSVVDLQRIKGLLPVTEGDAPAAYRPSLRLIEAVISPSSPLLGRTVRSAGIRTRYGAVVIAVHRHGQRVAGKIGDIVLRPGDTLLLEAAPGFATRHKDSADFYLVSELDGAASPRHERAWIALGILGVMVLAMTLDWADHMVLAMIAAGAMILLRCCTGAQARAGVSWTVLIVIGASFGLARAMEKTGLAGLIADTIVGWGAGHGPVVLLACVYAITLLFTTMISNNAAVALVFPIALEVARGAGVASFMPFAICIAIAASCEFMTPLGYQTNLMVMGPGGYRWIDFTRFGGPLTLLCAALCILLVPLLYGPL